MKCPEQEAELLDLIRLARSAAAAKEVEPCSTIPLLPLSKVSQSPIAAFISQCVAHVQYYCDVYVDMSSLVN